MNAATWKSNGEFISVRGKSLFVIDEGEKNNPVLLFLHGYPSCSYDYWKVLPLLTPNYRVIIHDHLGFGFSDKPLDYSYSLIDQADMALALWQQLGISEGHIVGHDYGTSVGCEIITRWNLGFRPIKLHSAILGNGSMLIEMAQLLLSQKLLMNSFTGPILAKFASEAYFQYNMKKLWWDKSTYDPAEISTLFEIGLSPQARKVFPQMTRYILERTKFWHRWITEGLYATELPIHLYWADRDPIAVIAMGHKLHQNIKHSTLEVIPDVGHYPMLEAPELWVTAMLKGMETH